MKRFFEVTLLIICGIAIILLSGIQVHDREDHSLADITVEQMVLNYKYGILLDSFQVRYDTVKNNEFLSDIFSRNGIGYDKVVLLDKVGKEVFDVRRFRQGKPYAIIRNNDTIGRVRYFVYEESAVEYVVFDLKDTLKVTRGMNQVTIRLRGASGIIESSLWNAMTGSSCDPNLANRLSEIYAWVIDFFGVQKGDRFKVIFEEKYVKNIYLGLGRIYAALLTHYGKDYYAFYFEQDSVGDYFDENGGSMRRTFLKAPLKYSRISSGYSLNRYHPILKIYRPHRGIDYAAPYGTPVYAVGDGIVTERNYNSEGGRTVKIKHNGTFSTRYLHLASYGKGIAVGAHVKQGDVVGYVGQSGLATGPHLDFRFYKNGQAVNPLKIESPPAKPVNPEYIGKFNVVRESMMEQLKKLN